MDKYIYFAAQLPLLVFDKEPALTINDFLEEGRKWLSDADYALLSAVSINSTAPTENDPAALREFKLYEKMLRDELDDAAREQLGHGRQALHAWSLRLRHPGDGRPLHLLAAPPADLLGLLPARACRGSAPARQHPVGAD